MPEDRSSRMRSSITFSEANGTDNDFGSFESEPVRSYAPPRKTQSNKSSFFKKMQKNKKATIIAASAIAAVVLIIAGVIIAACLGAFGSGDIKYQNNAYLTYSSGDKHYVVANGSVVDHEFKGEVELIPSADNSFAYVIDNCDDGIYLYILKGKKLTTVSTSPADEFITAASLKPAIIFTEITSKGTNYMVYSADMGTQPLIKDSDDPRDFLISADAKTVVYTVKKDDGNRVPYIYENGSYDKLADRSCTPVAISSNGDYVYVKRNVDGVDKLYVIDRTKKNAPVNLVGGSANFGSILEMNAKGDEIIFCTVKAPDSLSDAIDGNLFEVSSHLYRHKEKDQKSINLGSGYVTTSENAAPEIAVHKTFAKKYFEATPDGLTDEGNTFRLTNKFEIEKIYNGKGKFTSDGKYFYYVNKDGDLYQIDLKDKSRNVTAIYEDVKDFALTEKNNVYFMDGDGYLVFFKASSKAKIRISSYANEISMYRCANKLFFAELDGEFIYLTEEGSDKDIAKFGTTELKAVPYFSSQTMKKGYAVVYNESANNYSIYYTSNGNRFKLIKAVTKCEEITYGIDFPASIEW